ncbi:MAG: hypothetical protein ABI051_11650 [Vicinamibacterales bacterium]
MTHQLLIIKEWYWAHREVVRIAGGLGVVAMAQVVLVLWTARRLRELSHIRERMSRLADGLALLTDTTEAGMATLIREVEQMGRRRATARVATRSSVAKRVVAAAKSGEKLSRIAEAESLSESEVRLHLKLAEAAGRQMASVGPASAASQL